MSGHTPGPWGVEDIGCPNALAIVANPEGYAREWKLLAQVSDDFEMGVDYTQVIANARLMAAGPDMLAALEAVMYFWGRDPLAFGDEATINSLAGRFAAVADQCRVARNAARGLEDA